MADNRGNKDKRQRRNRAEREARAARSKHAGEATAIARGEADPAPKQASTRASARAAGDATATGGGKPTAVDRRAAARERMKARYPIPGQRAMFMGLLFTLVFVVTTFITDFPIPDEVSEDDPRVDTADDVDDPAGNGIIEAVQQALGDDAPPRQVRIYENSRLFDEEEPAVAGLILLLPTMVCGVAYLVRNSERRDLLWTMALFAMTGYFMFAQPYSLFALPSLVAVGIGTFQSRRATQEPRMAELRAQREARAAEAKAAKANKDDAVDVDPVESDD